ncbi:MAG: hypothetical protein OSB19_18765, partial [Opitutaceae bacterium]|nr:hypothetical protein [Opitutaceae bacterium]
MPRRIRVVATAWEFIDFWNKVIRIPPHLSKTAEYRTPYSLAVWFSTVSASRSVSRISSKGGGVLK